MKIMGVSCNLSIKKKQSIEVRYGKSPSLIGIYMYSISINQRFWAVAVFSSYVAKNQKVMGDLNDSDFGKKIINGLKTWLPSGNLT